jgi:hypothetical protein
LRVVQGWALPLFIGVSVHTVDADQPRRIDPFGLDCIYASGAADNPYPMDLSRFVRGDCISAGNRGRECGTFANRSRLGPHGPESVGHLPFN